MADREEEVINAAVKALEFAYAPYSQFRVGAAILSSSGNVFTGCNVENASYGLTVCAERVAIFKMISSGDNSIDLIVLASETDEPIPPCGACLQVIAEFSKENTGIICVGKDGRRKEYKLKDLFPQPFFFKKYKEK